MTDTQLAAAEQRIPVNGIELNVASAGSGDSTVLLLHGFPDSWQSWRHQIVALAEAGHRVIAPDLRGFGQSDRPLEISDCRMMAIRIASATHQRCSPSVRRRHAGGRPSESVGVSGGS